MRQCVNCGQDFKVWMVIDGKRRNLSNRTLCLNCLPFGSGNSLAFELKRSRGIKPRRIYSHEAPTAVCVLCERPRGRNLRLCGSCITKARRFIAKQKAIELLGGKCQRCGWSGHQSGFDFHHQDPSKKEFSVGNAANVSWERLKEEILKCELLCRNCHSIEHSNRDGDDFLHEVEIMKKRSRVYS